MFLRRSHKIICLGFLHLILILCIGCKTPYTPIKASGSHIQVQSSGDSTAPLITERFLKPYRQKLQDSFSTVIATTSGDLVKKRPGGSLGNFVTKPMWEFVKNNSPGTSQAPPPTFIIMNYGGIRLNNISAGKITIGKIYEILPFENTLVRIKIKGDDLIKLVMQINKSNGWPMKFNTKIYNNIDDINTRRYYELVTNNYIASGGDNCSILKTLPQKDTGILLRDIVIEYLRKQKTITPDNTDYTLK